MKSVSSYSKYIYPMGLAVLAILVFIYIFNPKIDINGDNCYYYIFASSLAQGAGYSNILGEPTALFPPGYPLLMTPLRFITDSVVAQKVLNLLFLFAGVLLLYKLLLCEGIKRSLAFIVGVGVLVTPHILEFSTMMMSEPACIFFITLSLLAFWRVVSASDKNSVPWRSPWLYLFVFATAYAFFIRTQAVVLFVAFVAALIIERRLKLLWILLAFFTIFSLPWMLRNHILGLEQSRYVSQIDFSNFFANMHMLLVKAIPESCLPFFSINYQATPTKLLYVTTFAMLSFMFYGFLQMKHLRVVLSFLFVGNIFIVSIMNTPSGYRYMIILLPLITAGVIVGLCRFCEKICNGFLKRKFSTWLLLLLFLPMLFASEDKSKHTIYGLRKVVESNYPPTVSMFLAIGQEVAKLEDAKIVASRKPELLYVHSGVRGLRYKEENTNIGILNSLLDDNVDYIILENMGFNYAYQVLYPFLSQHKELFTPVMWTAEPMTILFRFNKERARMLFVKNGLKSKNR